MIKYLIARLSRKFINLLHHVDCLTGKQNLVSLYFSYPTNQNPGFLIKYSEAKYHQNNFDIFFDLDNNVLLNNVLCGIQIPGYFYSQVFRLKQSERIPMPEVITQSEKATEKTGNCENFNQEDNDYPWVKDWVNNPKGIPLFYFQEFTSIGLYIGSNSNAGFLLELLALKNLFRMNMITMIPDNVG